MDINLNPIVYEVAGKRNQTDENLHHSGLFTEDHGLPQQFLETSTIPGSWNVLDDILVGSGFNVSLLSSESDAKMTAQGVPEQSTQTHPTSNDMKEGIHGTAVESDSADPFTAEEVFDLIRHINDPEHPLTLEQLRVAQLELITVDNKNSTVDVMFTPTIPHCSMALMIGLCLLVKLIRSLPKRFKMRISITPGTHSQEAQITKQLNDKERVAAALENTKLLAVVDRCVLTAEDHAPGLEGAMRASGASAPKRPLAKNIAGTRDRPMVF